MYKGVCKSIELLKQRRDTLKTEYAKSVKGSVHSNTLGAQIKELNFLINTLYDESNTIVDSGEVKHE